MLSTLTRLAPAPGICSLPLCDWLPLRVYALYPHATDRVIQRTAYDSPHRGDTVGNGYIYKYIYARETEHGAAVAFLFLGAIGHPLGLGAGFRPPPSPAAAARPHRAQV
eukprot:1189854-Prorocentrum_minimum.AAC.1